MAEASISPEARIVTLPDYIGAVFETGRLKSYAYDWTERKHVVPLVDVSREEDRDVWMLENMRVFADGTVANPCFGWKGIIDTWLTELRVAATRSSPPLERENLRKTEMDIKATMAVSASARAMEMSGGSAARYASYIAPGGEHGPDLDKQDAWAEFLLHKDPEKLNRVLENTLVDHYYKKLMEDAGITDLEEWHKVDSKWYSSRWNVDKEKAFAGKLIEYLKLKHSLNEYVDEVLLASDEDGFKRECQEKYGKKDKRGKEVREGVGNRVRWAAAKLACDAFLVDKYTRWQFQLENMTEDERKEAEKMSDETQKKDKLKALEKQKGVLKDMKPFPGWGGDPLRAVLEPSFLPGRIKKVYQEEDKVILDMTDLAFRPVDIFNKEEELKGKLLPASMVIHLKEYARYSDALWTFLGTSRAIAIPQWTKEVMGKDLPTIAELLDQVYGGIDEPKSETGKHPIGKHIVGAMMARILQCKALATAIESARPGFKENLILLFGETKTARPFLEIEQFLWGPNLDAKMGFLVSLAAGRTRFVFKDNDFGAEKTLKDTAEILLTNDQGPEERRRAKTLNQIGFVLDAIKAIAAAEGRRK